MINVVIGGDVCPSGINFPNFKKGDVVNIFNDLYAEIEEADLFIVNLECPLIKKHTPVEKNGPILGVDNSAINGIKMAKIDLLNLANNHILDHGSAGLENTLSVCRKEGISTVGAGKNLREASKIKIFKINNIKIGILGIAEHEFSIATENSYGANPRDLIETVRNIKRNSELFDYLIVLYHGGNEYYPYPSPKLQKNCRFLVEIGANLVVVQHTHWPGCFEEYKGSYIVYGQGDLIFDKSEKERKYKEGFLVKILIDNDGRTQLKLIPYLQSHNFPGTRKMKSEDEEKFLKKIHKRSESIKNPIFLNKKWIEFCEMKRNEYLDRSFGMNFVVKKLIRSKSLFKFLFKRKFILRFQNTVACEAHREVLETLLHSKLI